MGDLTVGRALCVLFFVTAGIIHFVNPDFYLAMMPPWVPAHLTMVYLSGGAEIAGGIGLLLARFRRAAGWGLIVLLVAIFPANIQMLLNAQAAGATLARQLPLWLRLPLQPLMIWWVWRVSQIGDRATPRPRPVT